jgi:uncharacterized membrane protein YcaP (DUF421 family)
MVGADAGEYSFDLHRIVLGDHPAPFYLEIALRTSLMFIFALVLLRMMGKRSLGQLSPFDLVIIIALGSAVGDPMFYDDVPLAHGATVVAVVLALYLVVSRAAQRSPQVERFLDSTPTILVRDGVVDENALRRQGMSENELVESLRLEAIASIDEVAIAILETSGRVSVLRKDRDPKVPELWSDVSSR